MNGEKKEKEKKISSPIKPQKYKTHYQRERERVPNTDMGNEIRGILEKSVTSVEISVLQEDLDFQGVNYDVKRTNRHN